MITLRPGQERGHVTLDWLNTYHTFSFDQYYDPKHMHFRSLRVLNEDVIQPGMGFGMHPHREMEIITMVLEGALEHKDNMGNGSVIRPGDIQRMTAGTGVLHSEFNPSDSEPTHLMQIWISPEKKGLDPGYEERTFDQEAQRGGFSLIAAREPRDGAVKIHQDAELYLARLDAGETAQYEMKSDRHVWLQVAKGKVKLNGTSLEAGDGAAVTEEKQLEVSATQPAELVLFDLA